MDNVKANVKGTVAIPAAIKVADLKCNHLPNTILFGKRPSRCFVKLFVDKDVKKTASAARGNTASWNKPFYFYHLNGSSELEIEVYGHRTFARDDYIGGAKERIELLLAEGATGAAIVRKLQQSDKAGKMHEVQTVLEFTISSYATANEAQEAESSEAVSGTKVVDEILSARSLIVDAGAGADAATSTVNTFNTISATWVPLVDKIRLFTDIVGKASEVHPYAKMAWSILSIAHKTIIDQMDRDDTIHGLAKIIGDTYAFVHLAEPLKKIELHKSIILALEQQTLECSYFIRAYAKNKDFWKRTVKNMVSDVDSKVKRYQESFNKLKLELQQHAMIHTEITVLRVLDVVGDISGAVLLADMPYADGAKFNPEKGCLPDTREAVMAGIWDWINQDSEDAPHIFFLNDVAGAGKSAIAHEVAKRLSSLKRLGSSYFFDRALQAQRSPDNVFSTIARDLADLDPERKASLLKVVGEQKALRTTRVPSEQFQKFILEPSSHLTAVGPTVIVIDALDECGDLESRQALLSVLGNEAAQLPSNFRLLITSRAERDIQDALLGKNHVLSRSLKDIDPNPADAVNRFVKDQLGNVAALERKWPNNGWCRLLVDKSEGHFQWASTACRFVKGDGKYGQDPVKQMEDLLVKNLRGMDKLYLGILKQIFGDGDDLTDDAKRRFRLVMGCMLAAREPLSMSAMQKLCNEDESSTEVHDIVRPMGALLSIPTQESDPISLLHTSFRDFLTDCNRSGPYHIDTSLRHDGLAFSSLRVMKNELCFNICQLETSHLHNKDVFDMATRTKKHISAQLSYSCRFWADHVRATTFTPGIGAKVKEFFEINLLYWLEVLSLIKKVPDASAALSSLMGWSQDNDTTAFVRDTRNFVATFWSVISDSAPHLYLSALPFTPRSSKLSRTYLPDFPRLLRIETGKLKTWAATQSVLVGHTDPVSSVAFSPDGKCIVSGSCDRTIRVWNADSGEVISGPFEGHTDYVRSVAFSPDSKHIVSGSDDKTIRMWNADSGEVISGPLEGHAGYVTSVAFSPDGKRIVSGSNDKTIRVWNADSGEVISGPFEGHTHWVRSVAFSPDGQRIVSGSNDNTIRVWNADTGQVISGPFEGHTDYVRSVAFSSDGKRIVSGSDDMTIRVWNADSDEVISGPIEGHTDWVTSVAFSPDGKRIVSGSNDKTVRVWNVDGGEVVSGPFEGHTDWVTSVAFSPDGKRIISGSNDMAIRVWNADSGEVISGTFDGHTDYVRSVAFSPDGKRIISGSDDKTIRVWNTDSGEVISGPFEGHTDWVMSVAFSPDGQRIVSGSKDKTIHVWNADSGETISGPIESHTDWVMSVAFSPDGKRIVSGSNDKTIRVWNADSSGIVSGPFEGHTEWIRSVAFSPNGKRIVSGSNDKTIHVWTADSGQVISGPFEGHTDWIRSVAFSPDGERIVSGSNDNTIRVWNADSGKVISGPFEGHTAWIRSVAFSPDGKRIVSGSNDNTIRVWNAGSGEVISGPFEGHTDSVSSVAFSPDGKRIVSGSADHTIRVWNADSGEVISGPFEGHTDYVRSVAFSPDGKRIISGSNDKAIRVWDSETPIVGSCPFLGQEDATWTGFSNESQLENGWLLNSPTQLLFWIPPWSRLGLWRPANTAVIAQGSTRLDVTRFVHGTSWTKCREAV